MCVSLYGSVHYVCVCMYVCAHLCVTMSCPVVFTSGDSSVVSCCFIYYQRISWFDLVMFSELVISLLPNEDKFHNHLLVIVI